jgi:hypothetical protein
MTTFISLLQKELNELNYKPIPVSTFKLLTAKEEKEVIKPSEQKTAKEVIKPSEQKTAKEVIKPSEQKTAKEVIKPSEEKQVRIVIRKTEDQFSKRTGLKLLPPPTMSFSIVQPQPYVDPSHAHLVPLPKGDVIIKQEKMNNFNVTATLAVSATKAETKKMTIINSIDINMLNSKRAIGPTSYKVDRIKQIAKDLGLSVSQTKPKLIISILEEIIKQGNEKQRELAEKRKGEELMAV